MNKQLTSVLLKIGIPFLVLAIVVAIVMQSGANHPPMRFPSIDDVTHGFLERLSKMSGNSSSVSLLSQGPFNWDNSKDLGFSKDLGEWSNEAYNDAVVYFRRDKDAQWQEKALSVLNTMEDMSSRLSGTFGNVCSAIEANGRKIPVYLPENEAEYRAVLEKLSDGMTLPIDKNGCSFINIGPLGCQEKGIVLNPSSFIGDDYNDVLRKEITRYAYLASMDLNETVNHAAWFVEGLIDYLAKGAEDLADITPEMIDYIENDFNLIAESYSSKSNEMASEIGRLFLQYYSARFGDSSLEEVIQMSLGTGITDILNDLNLDLDSVKDEWITYLRKPECSFESPVNMMGFIGDQPVHMSVLYHNNDTRGRYYYDKDIEASQDVNESLMIFGSRDGDNLSLTEFMGNDYTGTFNGVSVDGIYSGIYTRSSDGMQFPFELQVTNHNSGFFEAVQLYFPLPIQHKI